MLPTCVVAQEWSSAVVVTLVALASMFVVPLIVAPRIAPTCASAVLLFDARVVILLAFAWMFVLPLIVEAEIEPIRVAAVEPFSAVVVTSVAVAVTRVSPLITVSSCDWAQAEFADSAKNNAPEIAIILIMIAPILDFKILPKPRTGSQRFVYQKISHDPPSLRQLRSVKHAYRIPILFSK